MKIHLIYYNIGSLDMINTGVDRETLPWTLQSWLRSLRVWQISFSTGMAESYTGMTEKLYGPYGYGGDSGTYTVTPWQVHTSKS
jgi:hypothetical protein